jgi:hypothetical protein
VQHESAAAMPHLADRSQPLPPPPSTRGADYGSAGSVGWMPSSTIVDQGASRCQKSVILVIRPSSSSSNKHKPGCVPSWTVNSIQLAACRPSPTIPLERDVPVIGEALHVEPDVGFPAADLLPGLGPAVDHVVGQQGAERVPISGFRHVPVGRDHLMRAGPAGHSTPAAGHWSMRWSRPQVMVPR